MCPISERKSQAAIEFLVIIGVGMIAALFFFGASLKDIKEFQAKKEFLAVQDVTFMLQNELILAAQVQEGYNRSIEVPQWVDGENLEFIILNNILTVSTDETHFFVRIPSTSGNFSSGTNWITKQQGVISIEQ